MLAAGKVQWKSTKIEPLSDGKAWRLSGGTWTEVPTGMSEHDNLYDVEVGAVSRKYMTDVMALAAWANEHQSELRANRDAYDERALRLE